MHTDACFELRRMRSWPVVKSRPHENWRSLEQIRDHLGIRKCWSMGTLSVRCSKQVAYNEPIEPKLTNLILEYFKDLAVCSQCLDLVERFINPSFDWKHTNSWHDQHSRLHQSCISAVPTEDHDEIHVHEVSMPRTTQVAWLHNRSRW